MSLETRVGYPPVLNLEIQADLIAADGIAVFVGNIGMFQRVVIARILIMIDDVVAIEVFHLSYLALKSGNELPSPFQGEGSGMRVNV